MDNEEKDYQKVGKRHFEKEECPLNERIVIALQIMRTSGFESEILGRLL